ncbi:MAG: acyltransferase family protein [Paracoccaceae bacterium]
MKLLALPDQKDAIPSLDGIRALSIGIVFLAHAGVSKLIPGGFGVTIFFFLSGFLITTLLTREWDRHGRIDLGGFYLRRFWRLMPPLLVCLAVCYALTAVGLADGILDPTAIASHLFYFNNYYMVYSADPQLVTDGLTPLWSLSVEEHFYAIFPLIFILTARGRFRIPHYIAALIVVLLWRTFHNVTLGSPEWSVYLLTDTRMDSLLYGCLLAVMHWRGAVPKLPGGRIAALLVMGLALGAIMVSIGIRADWFRSTLRYSVQGVALMVLFHYAVTQPRMPGFRLLNTALMRRIGLYSYNIYLWHYVVIRLMEKHGILADSFPLFVLAAGLVTLAISALVCHAIELPIRAARARHHRAATEALSPASV